PREEKLEILRLLPRLRGPLRMKKRRGSVAVLRARRRGVGRRGRSVIRSLAVALIYDGLRDFVRKIVTPARAPGRCAFLAVAQESALDQDGRIGRLSQNTKIRGLHATIY